MCWIVTRHVIFGRIIWSVVSEPQTVLEYGWRSEDGYYFSHNTQRYFAVLLLALQLLICMWLAMSASSTPSSSQARRPGQLD